MHILCAVYRVHYAVYRVHYEWCWFTFITQSAQYIIRNANFVYFVTNIPTDSLIRTSSMYENRDCFKFHDITLNKISGLAITFVSNYHQTASFLLGGE